MALKIRILCVLVMSFLALSSCKGSSRLDQSPKEHQKVFQDAVNEGIAKAIGKQGLQEAITSTRNQTQTGVIVGAFGGLNLGNNLNKQEANLRQHMDRENIIIRNTGERLIVAMQRDILFEVESMAMLPERMTDLSALANNMEAYPNTSIQVIGHTDNRGNANLNKTLSLAQAETVKNVLISSGVAPDRIISLGRGEDQPVASNLTSEGRAQNRRVEIVILPNAKKL